MDEKAVVKIGADGAPIKCAKGLTEGCGYKAGAAVCGKCGAMAVQVKDAKDFEVETPEGDVLDSRAHRLATMGIKSAEVDDEAFVCAMERKVLPGGSTVCDHCPGGCVAEGDMPALLEVEGFAEQIFDGKVLDSGYSDEADLFVVDVERKDGKVVEAYFDGPTGEHRGWITLDENLLGEKSAEDEPLRIIGFSEAADLAVKSVDGQAVSVEADLFDGQDAYVVGVDGVDGNAYDVWISVDGKVLAEDDLGVIDDTKAMPKNDDENDDEMVDPEEEMTDESAMKAEYSAEERAKMAEDGHALPDGSFPIADEADLKNAIMAFGRAKDKEAAKAHIMKRAADLNLEDLIPENWDDAGKSADAEEYVGMNDDETPTDGKALTDVVGDPALLASLLEFQTLELEEELKDIL